MTTAQLEMTAAPPDVNELVDRQRRLQERMLKLGLDWFVIFAPANVYWLTDFTHDVDERPFLLLVPAVGAPVMIAPLLERDHVMQRTRLPLEVVAYREIPAPPGQTWTDALRSVLTGATRIGVEGDLPVGLFKHVPGSPIVLDLVCRLRWVKSPYEIARIAYSCAVLSQAHEAGLALIRPGASNADVSSRACELMSSRLQSDAPATNVLTISTFMMVWPQALSGDPHNLPELYDPLVPGGPQVTIGLLNAGGYAAELERTFFLGHVPEEARRPFEAMAQARELAFSLLRPGAVLGDIDMATRRLLQEHGYAHNLLHRTGHGMGLQGHEPPFLAEADETVAELGMVFSIEPGIYLPGIGGFRHSDTVLVTEDGCVSLTAAPDTIDELVLPV